MDGLYYLPFQASAGDLGMYPRGKGGTTVFYLLTSSTLQKRGTESTRCYIEERIECEARDSSRKGPFKAFHFHMQP